ncbi:MAG: hypothetical protein ACXWCQ_31940, partial [Burkholderiales bacterium]
MPLQNRTPGRVQMRYFTAYRSIFEQKSLQAVVHIVPDLIEPDLTRVVANNSSADCLHICVLVLLGYSPLRRWLIITHIFVGL